MSVILPLRRKLLVCSLSCFRPC